MQKLSHPSVALSVVAGTDDDGSLFGKDASDLQENIVIGNNYIAGTLKYISDYSSAGYTGDEKSGNFLVLKCEATDGATITVEVVGGVHGPSTLDEDGLVICRIANNNQSIKVVATKNGQSNTRIFNLLGLGLESA